MAIIKAVTQYGVALGVAGDADNTVFKGIPFAAPPVGEKRFAPPEPPAAWEGERLFDTFGPDCVQGSRPGEPPRNMSEDCLYLNVFTPANSPEDRLPVLFWIYGGGFSGGSGADPEFDGTELNRQGAVLVTINYRCNIFGFIAHPELEKRYGRSANLGLLDQIAALRWVRENIAAFGGDPERVLVFGQSAGGMSTRFLLTAPPARGLFSRAVIESGGGLNEADPVRSGAEYTAFVADCMARLGWSFADLMTREAAEVQRKMDEAAREVVGGFAPGYFQPFVDGVTLTDVPGRLVKEGAYMDIPIICGTVSGDSWMFTRCVREALVGNDSFFRGFSYAPGVAWAMNQNRAGRTPIRVFYMDRVQPKPKNGRSHLRNGPPPYGSDTPHGSEIAYIFGTLDRKAKARGMEFTDYDRELSRLMTRYWVNFAAKGDPNGEGLPAWPLYTPETPEAMHFGNDHTAAENIVLSEDERRALEHTIRNPGLLVSAEGL